jgi:hypothetical protein
MCSSLYLSLLEDANPIVFLLFLMVSNMKSNSETQKKLYKFGRVIYDGNTKELIKEITA